MRVNDAEKPKLLLWAAQRGHPTMHAPDAAYAASCIGDFAFGSLCGRVGLRCKAAARVMLTLGALIAWIIAMFKKLTLRAIS